MVVPAWEGTRPIAIVSACMQANGVPCFVRNDVEVTADDRANGVHYLHAEARLVREGYEEPWVHFDEFEAPEFLLAAVTHGLAEAWKAPDLVTENPREDR